MTLRDMVDPPVVIFFAVLFVCTGGLLVALGWWNLVAKPDVSGTKRNNVRKGARKDRLP